MGSLFRTPRLPPTAPAPPPPVDQSDLVVQAAGLAANARMLRAAGYRGAFGTPRGPGSVGAEREQVVPNTDPGRGAAGPLLDKEPAGFIGRVSEALGVGAPKSFAGAAGPLLGRETDGILGHVSEALGVGAPKSILGGATKPGFVEKVREITAPATQKPVLSPLQRSISRIFGKSR